MSTNFFHFFLITKKNTQLVWPVSRGCLLFLSYTPKPPFIFKEVHVALLSICITFYRFLRWLAVFCCHFSYGHPLLYSFTLYDHSSPTLESEALPWGNMKLRILVQIFLVYMNSVTPRFYRFVLVGKKILKVVSIINKWPFWPTREPKALLQVTRVTQLKNCNWFSFSACSKM